MKLTNDATSPAQKGAAFLASLFHLTPVLSLVNCAVFYLSSFLQARVSTRLLSLWNMAAIRYCMTLTLVNNQIQMTALPLMRGVLILFFNSELIVLNEQSL
jgi:hypothetical protein